MPTRALCASGFALALCLAIAPRTLAKPPDLPQQVHPDLTPEDRPFSEGAAEQAAKPAGPEVLYFPLTEPFAPPATAKAGEEEQETKTDQCAKCGCPFTCPLCGLLSGPVCAWLGKVSHREETEPIEPQQVFGSFDLSNVILHEVAGNNVRSRLREKQAAPLIRYIEEHVRPGSWESQGGKGGIDYNPETNSLNIRHDEDAQEQVSALLDNIRAAGSALAFFSRKTAPAVQQSTQPGVEEASSEPETIKPLEPTLVAMGHDVTDLLHGQDADEVVREMVRLIETTIAPKSWVNRGGSGQLHYNPELKTFFIVQTEEVQEAIREFINLRRAEKTLKKGDDESPAEEPEVMFPGGGFSFGHPISDLLETAHRELLAGRKELAEQLVRQALVKDRKAVLAHPLVYKMQLLHQVLSEPVQLTPHMPGIDPGVVRAYHEILELAPKKTAVEARDKPAVLEVVEEECELEIVPDSTPAMPTLCFDKDGKRVRIQLQFGGMTIKLLDEGKGKSSLTIDLGITSPSK